MASIKAYEREDGTLVLTLHGKGREAKLLSKYGARFILAPQRVCIDDHGSPFRDTTTVRLEIPSPKKV